MGSELKITLRDFLFTCLGAVSHSGLGYFVKGVNSYLDRRDEKSARLLSQYLLEGLKEYRQKSAE